MENLTYEEFIQNILSTRGRFNCGDEYHEKHHIIPICLGGGDEKENLIDLFAKEHFIAHKLLAKKYPHNSSLTYAWWMMSHIGRVEISDEEYEEARISFCKAQTGRVYSEESRRKISDNHADISGENNPFFGKTHTEETKLLISEQAKKRCENEEYRKAMSERMVGRFKGGNHPMAQKVIRLCDLEIYPYIGDAAIQNNMCRDTMKKYCKNRNQFMFYDEWLELQNELEDII